MLGQASSPMLILKEQVIFVDKNVIIIPYACDALTAFLIQVVKGANCFKGRILYLRMQIDYNN